MTSGEYQSVVGDEYCRRGYQVEVQTGGSDWGADLFATRGSERIALRVKMQTKPSLPVDRAMVLILEGVRRYFDCTGAALVTNGRVLPEAHSVAQKLGISIEWLDFPTAPAAPEGLHFDRIWSEWIRPLQGQTLASGRGADIQVVKVDGSGIERINSKGQSGFIPLEVFRTAVNRLLEVGIMTRDEIHALCMGRASSGVALILSQVPDFDYGGHPPALRFQTSSPVSVPARPQSFQETRLDSVEALKEQGFAGFHTIQELWADSRCIPKEKGIYLVLYSGSSEPEFLLHGSGGHSKGNPNVSLRILRSNWVKGQSIVYIGKAGGGDTKATLHSRLKQYLEFGQGKPAKHYGGRFVWQMRDSAQLRVAWKSLAEEDPAKMESDLIRQFVEAHGQLPFANLLD